MLKTLNCPNCGAPLEYTGGQATLQCPFCNNTVEVPAELRPQNAAALPAITLNWREWSAGVRIFVIVMIAVVVVPTCLGLAGSCAGIAVSVLAPLAAIFLPFLIHR